MLIIFIAHVTELLFLLHLLSIEICIFFPQHHFYTDVTRDGPDRRKDSTEEQTHDSSHLLYDSEHHIIATNLTGKNWGQGVESRLMNDFFCGFGLNFVCRYETFRHVRTPSVKHMYLIVWLFHWDILLYMFTACVVFVVLPVLWVISQVIFLVWTKVMHVLFMRLLQYIISR